MRQQDWDWEISKKTTWLGVSFAELYSYKDLCISLTRKEFLSLYQQTLLGPFWVLLQPLLTVITYVLVFNVVIGVPTDNVPPFLFNLIGITLWNLFSEIFLNVSKTFSQNAQVFSRVYFPRIIVTLSSLLLQLILFCIQFLFLIITTVYFSTVGQIHINYTHIYLVVPIIITTAVMGYGGGMIFSVLCAKYRDLLALMQLILRLLMFVCPIFYSLTLVPKKVKWLVDLNPLSAQFELFRYAILGKGAVSEMLVLYSFVFMVLLVCFGVLIFNKMGDNLMDVI